MTLGRSTRSTATRSSQGREFNVIRKTSDEQEYLKKTKRTLRRHEDRLRDVSVPLAANPRVQGTFLEVTPFLGGIGMIPAWPKRRATVSDGCAPTLSQYLRFFFFFFFFLRRFFRILCARKGVRVWCGVRWNGRTVRKPEGGSARERTWRGRSSSPCACYRRSLRVREADRNARSAGSERRGSAKPTTELGLNGRKVVVHAVTHPALGRSAR